MKYNNIHYTAYISVLAEENVVLLLLCRISVLLSLPCSLVGYILMWLIHMIIDKIFLLNQIFVSLCRKRKTLKNRNFLTVIIIVFVLLLHSNSELKL